MIEYVAPGALPWPKHTSQERMGVALDQMIWGHRFTADQTPWLTFLETLGLLASRLEDPHKPQLFEGRPDEEHEDFVYRMNCRSTLRWLLFTDSEADKLAAAASTQADAAVWQTWRERAAANDAGRKAAQDLTYLEKRFPRFATYHGALDLLRSAEIEAERDRRPTSRHLAPRGLDLLMADYERRKTGAIDNDRRFFARGGEIVYLMLARSARAGELASLIEERLLTRTSRWNRLAELLEPEAAAPGDGFENHIGYLPMPHHARYDRLAEDWIAVLSRRHLPDDQLPDPLMRLTGLHVLLYVIERAADMQSRRFRLAVPIDMSPQTPGALRRQSMERFQLHRQITRTALAETIDTFEKSKLWGDVLSAPDPIAKARTVLGDWFGFAPAVAAQASPETLLDELRREASKKHDNNMGRIAGFYAEQIGMTVGAGTRRWYGLTDSLTEALVLANVAEPLEYELFLERLQHRYGLVIGNSAGSELLGDDAPLEQLEQNQRLFEERLRVLGLLSRLSDDCAFVSNPFHGGA